MVVIEKHRRVLEKLGLATLAQVKNFRGELVKDHHGRRDIFRIVTQDETGRPLTLFLKRNWHPYKKDGLASLLRHGAVRSIARQEWENMQALEAAGVRCAGRVACGEECGPLWERFSFLVTEAAAGQQTLERFLHECRDRVERRRVLEALAAQVRRMHDAGLSSPDLYTRHIFVDTRGAEPEFCLIDMVRLDRRRPLPPRLRARDLAVLNLTAPLRVISATERVRFLRAYAGNVDRTLVALVARRVEYLLKRRRKFRSFFPSD
jgi:tRNA A-37 threonylcarbamoyl transferase component Bud32